MKDRKRELNKDTSKVSILKYKIPEKWAGSEQVQVKELGKSFY